MIIIVGILIGLVLGLTGAGGSVFSVPLLVGLLQLPPQQAIGVSLGAVAISAGYGALMRFKSRNIQWAPALIYAAVGGVFAPVGSLIGGYFSGQMLMLGFSALVCAVALTMWRSASHDPALARDVRASVSGGRGAGFTACATSDDPQTRPVTLTCLAWLFLGASVTGLLSGLFGVGGGFIIVPILMMLTGLKIEQAVATSLVVITVVSAAGFFSFVLTQPQVDFLLLQNVALGGVIGMTIGGVVAQWIAGPSLQKGFSILMVVMALVTIATQLMV